MLPMRVLLKMGRPLLVLLTIGLSAACGSYLDWRYGDLKDTAEQLLRAVSEGDTALVESLTATPALAERFHSIRRQEPGFALAGSRGLDVIGAVRHGDTTVVHFSFRYEDREEEMGIRFVRKAEAEKWIVVTINFPSRI